MAMVELHRDCTFTNFDPNSKSICFVFICIFLPCGVKYYITFPHSTSFELSLLLARAMLLIGVICMVWVTLSKTDEGL